MPFILVGVLYCSLRTFSALTSASLVNSFQCTNSNSKKPKNVEDEEVSAAVDGAEGPTPDPDPEDLKVSEKPEEAVKLGNTEAPSEDEASASRMQLDQNSSDNIRLSGEKFADCFTCN